MAATQAEKQQNDVNSEKVQPDQHLNVRNSLLQNGTEKSGVRGGGGVAVTKAKNTGSKNIGIDMSQYRQDGGGGGGGGGGGAPGPVSGDPDQETGPTGDAPHYPAAAASEGPPTADGHAYGFSFAGRDTHNSSDGNIHSYGPRHGFAGQKPQQQQQPRFLSGQSTGPTPTLNQLLSSTMPRYQNSYGHPEPGYNQAWGQKPVAPYGPAAPVFRTQTSSLPAYSGAPGSSPGGGGGTGPGYGGGDPARGWPAGPGSPGPPPPSAQQQQQQQQQQPSPQPTQQQSHSPGPTTGMPTSPQQQHQHQGFPSRPAQPTTPNAHGPDATDGNSNDSSGGPAPGTPNSQGMRPTPSPTGSTGSRSMSPAVGQQNIPMPPRPSSGQSEGGGNGGSGGSSGSGGNGPGGGGGGGGPGGGRLSHSPLSSQGGYPPSHMHYKGHPGMVPGGAPQQMPLYPPPNQQYQGAYPGGGGGGGRSQGGVQYPSHGYGPPGSQQGAPPTAPPANNLPQQYPRGATGGSGAPNHMANSQFPPYQQQPWQGPPVSTGNHVPPGKGSGPPPQAPGSPSSGPPRQPHYLKQHLQHKMGGFSTIPSSIPPSPSPPQNYHMGPPPVGHHHSGMGPPPTMGPPPNMPPATSPLMPNSHMHDGPMPPPSSTPNSHNQLAPDMMDNGITTMAAGGMGTHVTATSGGSVTSVVTTGPDGTPVDEGSQQSTLSNASAASGEDPQCTTPKSRKNDMGHYSHPTTPQSTVPSPGAASMNSMHEEYGDINSPSWPRTPASPKTDSLSKLYEMDDSPERRVWLDKLLAFMEERRTPITTCPTISKNPLDLFRLYVYVKDRGGFMEVTKNKTWKDIAGMLGIGASSSAAYTLRKHYTKNLLAYECQFDRGGIDPQPIINQVEASSKKKGAKAVSVPSPGSSNSQDSFPPPGSGSTSMDGYPNYGYMPGNNPEYNTPNQRPSSQANAPSPHGGSAGSNHLNSGASGGPSPAGGTGDNVNVSNPFDDVSPSPPPRGGPFQGGSHPPYPSNAPPRSQGQGYSGGPGGYGQYPGSGPPDQYSPYPGNAAYPPATRPVYPPYSGGESGPPTSPGSAQGAPPPGAGQDPYNRYNMGSGPGGVYRPPYGGAAGTGPPASQPPSGPYPGQQDYYRDQNYPNQQSPGSGNFPPANKNMPPPAPQPRRHPDFAKEQQPYPQYGQARQQIYVDPFHSSGGWPNNNQYRGQYGAGASPQTGNQQWNQPSRPSGQWDRFPANQGYQQPPQQGGQQWSPMPTPGVGQNPSLRQPVGPRTGKPFPMIPQQGVKGSGQFPSPMPNSYGPNQIPKREISFPPDSVEATLPVLYRRKRLCRADLGPVDAWRIMMCLRSGLLAESCYALDVLNVLLFDDTSVAYFMLNQWPGLLDLLLEHFRRNLGDMFDGPYPPEPKVEDDKPEVDLGSVKKPVDEDKKTVLLNNTTNYSFISRKGNPVKMTDASEDLFVRDDVKDWDTRGDAVTATLLAEIPTDPWHLNFENILPAFQAEFGRIPFYTRLKDVLKNAEPETEPHRTPPPDEVPPPAAAKSSDRKRRTKTLSDVISRIKKESAEVNDALALEIKEKVKTEKLNCEQQKSGTDVHNNATTECVATALPVHDPAGTLKRRRITDYEDEAYTRDEASLYLLTESQDCLGKRCVCISNILRSLTFIPGNEAEFARNSIFLGLIGKLLLLHHDHPPRTQKTRNYDREEDADFADSCSSLQGEGEWWWDFLVQLRENMLVCAANIAGQIDLSQYPEEVARSLLDGLLHWAVCPSAHGQDSFTSAGPSSLLSPQRLALEALCKLCVTNSNVDLVIATPPFSRLERLCAVLTKHLCRSEDQVLREFSINLLHYLAAADSSMARVVAMQSPCVSLLVAFIEQAEQSALGVANQLGIGALRDNPDSMGTSLDMLRRAASTLVFLAHHPDNRPLLVQQESRLLALVMSQILDQQVALLLSKVLFQISRS